MRYAPEKAQPYLFHQFFQLFKVTLLFALLMMVCRFVFIGLFTELVVLKKNLGLTAQALFLGLRYDLIAIAYVMALPYLVTCSGFIFSREGWLRFIPMFHRVWLFLSFLGLLTLAVCDLGFYSHFQEHINILFFGLWEDDTVALFTTIYKNYNVWFWGPVIIIGLGIVWWLFTKIFARERIDLFYSKPMQREELGLITLSGVVVIAFFARGNFTRLPLSIEDAHISDIESINELSVNGLIALNRAIRVRSSFGSETVRHLEVQGYGTPAAAAADILSYRGEAPRPDRAMGLETLQKRTPENPALAAMKPHVVVFLMESFGSYWWPYEKELPFLDSFRAHTESDFLFLNFLSSENGTIGSTVAMATNLPLRPGARFLSEGEYMRTLLASGAHLPYERAGYTSRFVYGGKLGWRQLGSYLQAQGWDVLDGADQLKEKMNLLSQVAPENLGNEWGLFDEHLFNYVARELAAASSPQVFFVLTTSNHPPYETPRTFKPEGLQKLSPELAKLFIKTPEESLRRLRTLQYANRQLGNFLTNLKASELKDKVVVAATGDHSFWIGKDEGTLGLVRKYGVPFYLYLPTALRPAQWDKSRWGSHIDIWPTLYHRTLSQADYWAFGSDMFAPRGAALNAAGIVAGSEGAVINGVAYCWAEEKWLKACGDDGSLKQLHNFSRAQIGLTDEFLRANAASKLPAISDSSAGANSGQQ